MKIYFVLTFILVSRECCGRAVDDGQQKESVVSVYTTQPTTAGTVASLDVYHQIATNIAERITSPIYRFLGIGTNTTVEKTTKRPWDNIELLDDKPEVLKPEIKPVDNDISLYRDIEELSSDASNRTEKRPEKIILYSSYLPSQKLQENVTDDVDDPFSTDDFSFDFDDERSESPREGPLVFILEMLSSIAQLIWGGLTSIFKS